MMEEERLGGTDDGASSGIVSPIVRVQGLRRSGRDIRGSACKLYLVTGGTRIDKRGIYVNTYITQIRKYEKPVFCRLRQSSSS